MIISICAIVLIVTFFSVFNFRNKFINIIMLYLCSVCMMLFISVLYIAKFINYNESGAMDLMMYLYLTQLRLNVSQINLLYNIAMTIYIFASMYFLTLINNISRIKILPLFVIIGVLYMYTNSHSFIWILYCKINYASPSNTLWKTVSLIISAVNITIISLTFVLPFLFLFIYLMNTRIYIKKKNAVTYGVCLGTVDIYMIYMFIAGIFPTIPCTNINSFGIPKTVSENNIAMNAPVISLFIIIFILMIILYFKPFNLYVLMSRKEISRNAVRINKNIRMTMHTHKNAFIEIEKKAEISQAIIEMYEPELLRKHLTDISERASESIHRIERMLDTLRDPKLIFEELDLSKCVMSAVSKVSIPGHISLKANELPLGILVHGNREHLTEVFVNIIINAVEAIEAKETAKSGSIDISIVDEGEIVAVNFTDNGCGIPKNSYRDIYKPFFSTKSTTNCGGIGLDYVNRIVKSHRGDVYVKSKVGCYTMFQIVLPIIRKGKNYEQVKNSHMRRLQRNTRVH